MKLADRRIGYNPLDVKPNKFFVLRNDCDCADVIPLYQSKEDVIAFVAHRIGDKGYVECCGDGCPYCVQNFTKLRKLFIPLYDIAKDEVVFWDRSIHSVNTVISRLFSEFSNPSEYVFRITRRGERFDPLISYDVCAIAKNTVLSYDEILEKFGIQLPDAYSNVIELMSRKTEEPQRIETNKILTPLICKCCGAPIQVATKTCNYCGTSYLWKE